MFDPNSMIEISEGSFTDEDLTSAGELFAKAGKHTGPIVIHFHGGLVSRRTAIASALADGPHYRDCGAYPIFPIWKTGVFEVLPEVLRRVAAEALFQMLLDRVLGFAHAYAMNAVGSRSLGLKRTLPPINFEELSRSSTGEKGDFRSDYINTESFDQLADLGDESGLSDFQIKAIEASVRNDTEFLSEIDAVLKGADLPLEEGTRSSANLLESLPAKKSVADREFLADLRQEAGTRSLSIKAAIVVAKIVGKVILRFVQKKDHGVHATVVEEVLREAYGSMVGTITWSVMKGYAETSVEPGGAGLEMLRLIKENLQGKRILLVGHSAGSIFCSHLIHAAAKSAEYKDLKFEAAFLAPAIRTDEFNDLFLSSTQVISQTGNELDFRIFTMSDHLESRDTLIRNVPNLGDLTWLYPRSLLFLIAGILEGKDTACPILGLQRSHRPGYWAFKDPKVTAVRDFVNKEKRIVYSINDGADEKMRTNSESHGGFGSFFPAGLNAAPNTTMQSLGNILKSGW